MGKAVLQGWSAEYRTFTRAIISLSAVGMSLFHLYTGATIVFTSMVQRPIHLAFALGLIFLLFPSRRGRPPASPSIIDWGLATFGVAGCGYIVWNHMSMEPMRTVFPTVLDLAFGVITIALVIECARRTLGPALAIVATIMILYGLFGHLLPLPIGHSGLAWKRIVSLNYLLDLGIFGVPLGVSASFVFLFVLLAAFLDKLGAGSFIVDFTSALMGRTRGGPAKIAVFSSALFATISGSGPANVAATGQFTIPLMMQTGYSGRFAGAVEAVASIGGQLMPPIMGAAAFVMAEFLEVPYIHIVKAAILPAVLYYIFLFLTVDFEAARLGLRGLSAEELADRKSVRETLAAGWHFILPLGFLVFLLIRQISPLKAGFWGIVAMVGIWALRLLITRQPIDFRLVWEALEQGAKNALPVAAACAAAGIVINIVSATGMGLLLSGAIVDLSGGNLLLLLLLTLVASLILGMGLPTTPCYIIVAIVAAPALINVGIIPIVAHLFVFYFAIISAITPPVALAAYVAAGISNDNPMQTGLTAFRIGIVGFVLPFMFVYGPALLLLADARTILWTIATSSMGVVSLAAGSQGYLMGAIPIWRRGLFIVGGLSLIFHGLLTDLFGMGALGIAVALQAAQARREKTAAASSLTGHRNSIR